MTITTTKVIDLEYLDFANRPGLIPRDDVDKVIEDKKANRVWISTRNSVWFQMLEVKNIETVINWGRSSGKLSNWED